MSKLHYFLLFVLCSIQVSALLVTPATHILTQGTTTDAYTISILNDEARPLTLTLTPTGPFDISVTNSLTLQPGQRTSVPLRVEVPTLQPGRYVGGVLIESRPTEGDTVSATTAVQHSIRYTVPSTGVHFDATILSSTASVGNPAVITVVVTNTGSEPIEATVQLALENKSYSKQVAVQPGQQSNVLFDWTPTALGIYPATAAVIYAGATIERSTNITVGTLVVQIVDVTIGTLQLGEPFRVTLIAQNQWGAPLPTKVTTTLLQNGTIISTAQNTLTLPAGERTPIILFVESTGVRADAAELRTVLYYADEKATDVQQLSFASPPVLQSNNRLWIVVVLLLLLLIISIIFIRKRRVPPQHAN
jgi:hypothetical protein